MPAWGKGKWMEEDPNRDKVCYKFVNNLQLNVSTLFYTCITLFFCKGGMCYRYDVETMC